MRQMLFLLALAVLISPANAQDVVHQWMVVNVDTSAMKQFHEKAVISEDTANVEKAGAKRQVWMSVRETKYLKKDDSTVTDRPYTVMFNCESYQIKFERDPWRDIDLAPTNI